MVPAQPYGKKPPFTSTQLFQSARINPVTEKVQNVLVRLIGLISLDHIAKRSVHVKLRTAGQMGQKMSEILLS